MADRQNTREGVDRFNRVVNVELTKGDFKKQPNNPKRRDGTIHIYCPSEHVASEMDNLILLHDR